MFILIKLQDLHHQIPKTKFNLLIKKCYSNRLYQKLIFSLQIRKKGFTLHYKNKITLDLTQLKQ